MIKLSDLGQVYIVCGKTDLRKGIDGLAILIKEQFELDPFSGKVFLFCGGRKDRFKALCRRFSNHVSAVPNDQIKRVTGLKFRQNVNSFGPLGYELDLTQLDDEEKDAIKQHISWYKQRRDLQ